MLQAMLPPEISRSSKSLIKCRQFLASILLRRPGVVVPEGTQRLPQFFGSDQNEPRHIHASRDGADAKFWLDPEVDLAQNRGFTAKKSSKRSLKTSRRP